MKKKRNIMLFLIVFSLILIVLGVTYAWFVWKSDDTKINAQTGCFNINYNGSFSDTKIKMTSSYEGGVVALVNLSVNNTCDIQSGIGTLYLKTNSFSANEVSLIENGALKYVIFNDDTKIDEGVINSLGDTIILDNIEVDTTEISYSVYLWLDGNIADDTYTDAIFDGSIYAEVAASY